VKYVYLQGGPYDGKKLLVSDTLNQLFMPELPTNEVALMCDGTRRIQPPTRCDHRYCQTTKRLIFIENSVWLKYIVYQYESRG